MSGTYLAQLGGMVKYEFKMHWRRRGILIVTLSIMVLLAISILLVNQNNLSIGGATSGGPGLSREEIMSFALLMASWAPMSMALAFIFPVVVSDSIPLDRQQGVSELLNSLPLRPATYITGKLLAAWMAGLSVLVVVLPATGVLWRLLIGSYVIRPYVEMALFGAVSLVILNVGLGVLAASGQATRRRAVVLTVALPLLFVGVGFGPESLLGYLSPVRGPIIMYFMSGWSENLYQPASSFVSADVLLTIAVGLVEVGVAWLAAVLWLRRKGI